MYVCLPLCCSVWRAECTHPLVCWTLSQRAHIPPPSLMSTAAVAYLEGTHTAAPLHVPQLMLHTNQYMCKLTSVYSLQLIVFARACRECKQQEVYTGHA